MYNTIKKLIPKDFLIKNEPFIRNIIYKIFYKGNKHQCNICEKKNSRFLINQRGEKLCPNCGSMPRDRRLFDEFSKIRKDNETIKLLDFSPSRSLYRKLKKDKNIEYFPTDLSTDFIAEYQYDITNIPQPDNHFDVIFCYHILEHIPQDTIAMTELFRILKPEGQLFVQTPFKTGEIYENPEVKTEKERLEHFGQEDHVRVYSVDGLAKRLEKVGFRVDKKHFKEDDFYGFQPEETILFVNKN